jgi:orotate phosphoribosyltransferase
MTNIDALATYLYKISAVRRGQFKLSGGGESDIYVDGRAAALDAEGLSLICACMTSVMPFDYDSIGCMEGPGSCVILGGLLQQLGGTGYVIRKQPKGHGTQKMVEGNVGQKPVLIDDVATSGKSLIHAIQNMPVRPIAAVVLIDREEGAAQALESYGVKLTSVLTLNKLREHK